VNDNILSGGFIKAHINNEQHLLTAFIDAEEERFSAIFITFLTYKIDDL